MLAIVIIAIVIALAAGGGGGKKDVAQPTEPVVTAAPLKQLPNVCDILPAATVGQIVGRSMVARHSTAGNGCVYTTTDTPHINVSTAYPPFVSQVTVFYNASSGGLTAERVAELFQSQKSAGSAPVSGVGEQAYAQGDGTGVAAPDCGVMAVVSIGATRRPESLEEVRGHSAAIAQKLLAAFPR